MPKINFEKIVKVERNKVFDVVTNYEKFQTNLPKYFPSIKVKSVRDNVAVVEEHVIIADKELVMMAKHVIQYPELHEVFVLGGDAKGSRITEKFQNVPEGTKIVVDADIKLNGVLRRLGFFGKGKITKSLVEIIDEFSQIAENQSD